MLKLERLIDDVLIHSSTAEGVVVLTINRALATAVHDDKVSTADAYETPWACGMLTEHGDLVDGLDDFERFVALPI